MVGLVCQDYFDRYMRNHNPSIILFKMCKWRRYLLEQYVEVDITFLRLKVTEVGILVAMSRDNLLGQGKITKLPDRMVWELAWLSYQEFPMKYSLPGVHQELYRHHICKFWLPIWSRYVTVLKDYCLPLLQVKPAVVKEIYKQGWVYPEAVTINKGIVTSKNTNIFLKMMIVPQVMVGINHQSIFIPMNAALTVPGMTTKVNNKK